MSNLAHVTPQVPADMRVISLHTATLRAEQASLTGESVAVNKQSDPVKHKDCEIQAKDNMLFAGTAIANGSCVGIVNSTGMKTEIGSAPHAPAAPRPVPLLPIAHAPLPSPPDHPPSSVHPARPRPRPAPVPQ